MKKEQKLKYIGLAMCIPALIMAVYLAFNLGFIIVALLTAISTGLCVYGIKLAKGDSLEDVKQDLLDDLNDLRDKE
jgi:hypothetical protein